MGIYIKGFIPTDGLYVIKDGVIRKYKGKGGTVRPYELVEVKEPHWIPVSERLPEKEGYYLVSEDDGGIEVEWYDNTGWGYCGVIAWMPLPEPWKGVDDENVDVL